MERVPRERRGKTLFGIQRQLTTAFCSRAVMKLRAQRAFRHARPAATCC